MANIWDVLKIAGAKNSPANMAWKTKGQGGFGAFGLMINELLKKDKDEENKDENKDDKKKKLSTADKLGHTEDIIKGIGSVLDPETKIYKGVNYQSWV